MKITKVLVTLAILVALNLLTPCTCKNVHLEKMKAELDVVDKNVRKKHFKKKFIISSVVIGVAILVNVLAAIGYYNYKKKEQCQHEHNNHAQQSEMNVPVNNRAKLTKEIIDEVNRMSEKNMAEEFKSGRPYYPKLKDVMLNIENEVKRRNEKLDRYNISDMSYDIFRNLYHISELWKKNPNLIPSNK
ncbi:early transcribed membrane protein, putative [Plasmodium knowlesi strain H]|uniref:Early transcribed membrane protein, putative n=3 Tax=Plasmodium knowlesi TaxID=5850 RepID=A0A5K1UN81_PLAKH|nr:early transcribed membrane protein [Plasmodium knowlesi strain H]OTN67433.1 putative Early transcribed membrane protein [Plasmodium knowlesi]CAA9987638.1 early transcribed membrane protein [Plasmodium knowlesi strain H]SBO26959.1 early transcribed membrane protein, putative [Plasmodium knowlesi strain H]SBO29275.1 early transcribed membrane protein, putative [Plasmodium knowlesi strain H]VVS77112.1 early transcribed membrane protein [Plasmodium knowlesi strain H]|eukprot:XP_002258637.1 early transcribed membrane protein, putative [Plasmodium knowlesi strain H]